MNKYSKTIYLILFIGFLLTALVYAGGQAVTSKSSEKGKFETRCGWFMNPTPSNFSLYDRDGEWIIGVQGGHQAENDWDWPAFTKQQWVRTNGDYGYGCVCMKMRVENQTHLVLAIKDVRAQPLAVCRQDQALEKWKQMFK